jgi:guanylate kinase
MKKASHEDLWSPGRSRKPLLIVLSGPSGAGKDAVLSKLRELDRPLKFIKTVTTRPPRSTECTEDYHFVSGVRFQEMRSAGELLEWANVYGNWYGVPKEPVRQALNEGLDTVLKVDIQGAATIKKLIPRAVLLFLTPPSLEEIINRLKQRRTESDFDLALRTKTAEEEVKQLPIFDYLVINRQGDIDRAVSDIEAIIIAENCRVNRRETSP